MRFYPQNQVNISDMSLWAITATYMPVILYVHTLRSVRRLLLPDTAIQYPHFFANLSARYGWDYNPLIANQLFIGDQVLSTYTPAGNDAHQIQVYGGLSKGLRSGRIVLGADVGYMQLHTTTMRQNVQSPYTIRYCYVRPSMKGNFTRWLSSDYSLSYTNTMNINNAERSTYHILKQNLTFTFIPGSNWQICSGRGTLLYAVWFRWPYSSVVARCICPLAYFQKDWMEC